MTETPPMTSRRRLASYAQRGGDRCPLRQEDGRPAALELTPAQKRRARHKHGRVLKRGRKRRAARKLEQS